MRKNSLPFLVFLLICSCQNSERKTFNQKTTPARKEIIKRYTSLSYISNTYPDSLGYYANRTERLAANQPPVFQAMASFIRGVYHQNTSSNELARKCFEKTLKLVPGRQYDTIQAKTYIGLGSVYKNFGEYPKAFDYLYKALRIYEKHRNKYGMASSYGSLAQIHQQKNDVKAARENLLKAMEILGDDKENQFYLIAAHTLANLYGMNGDFENALKIDREGIAISDKIKSPRNKSTFLDNKANCFMYSNQLDSAAYYFDECLKIDRAVGEKKQIADTYINLATLSVFQKNFPQAEQYIKQSIQLLKSIKQRPNLNTAYEVWVDLYRKQGKFEKALEVQKEKEANYMQMISEKKESALAEFKVVYETQKKEHELAESKLLLLEKEAKVRQKNLFLIATVSLALFIGLAGYFIYRQQKLKISQQEQEFSLRTALAQIERQNDLQEQRLAISRDLHDNIGSQLTFIISSVENLRYAFKIEEPAMLSKLESIGSFTRETISELRDTIWAMNITEIGFEDLRARIHNFIEKARQAQDYITFEFEIDQTLDQIRLSSLVAMNIYRTLQEAINNALKYASPKTVNVSVKREGDSVVIEIEDDGQGFDAELVQKGNGIFNMQKRMESIGASFHLVAKQGKGTLISILLPLKNFNND